MKKTFCLFLTLIIISALCSCTEGSEMPETTNNIPKLTLDDFYFYERIEHVGEVPQNFEQAVKNNAFYDSVRSSDTFLQIKAVVNSFSVSVYDYYGNLISSTEFEIGDYCHFPRVFPTSDGNFLILFEIDYTREKDKYYIKDGSASKLVKIDKNGTIIFETEIEDRINGEIRFLIETDSGYLFAGNSWRYETLQIDDRTTFSRIPSDILLTYVDPNGKNVGYGSLDGSRSDSVEYAEYKNGEAILYLHTGSTDGDFSEKGYWKYNLDASLNITQKIKIENSDIPKDAIGYLSDNPIYSIKDFIPDFDAGGVTHIIEYDDSILIISNRAYATLKQTIPQKSSTESFYETVYSSYSKDGKLIWRSAAPCDLPGYLQYDE